MRWIGQADAVIPVRVRRWGSSDAGTDKVGDAGGDTTLMDRLGGVSLILDEAVRRCYRGRTL